MPGRPLRVLSAGYPDILVGRATIANLFGEEVASRVTLRPDAADILKWHSVPNLDHVIESGSLFAALDCTLDVIDVARLRGNEMIADLNYPLPADFPTGYDIVLDSGTCEHVFNAGQAIINLASMVAVGGYIIQAAPFNSYNHGFYNFSPTLYYDFYSAENGYKLLYLKGFSNLVHAPKQFDVPPVQRFHSAPENSILIGMAQRVEAKKLHPVVQHKYKSMIGGSAS
jgi:hypothetical protein